MQQIELGKTLARSEVEINEGSHRHPQQHCYQDEIPVGSAPHLRLKRIWRLKQKVKTALPESYVGSTSKVFGKHSVDLFHGVFVPHDYITRTALTGRLPSGGKLNRKTV